MSSYYITRKSFSVWISLAFAMLALVAGANQFIVAKAAGITMYKMTGIAAIPLSAAAFAFAVLLFGRKRFGLTVFPVIIGCLSFIISIAGRNLAAVVICRIFCVIAGIVYVSVIFKKIKTNTLLVYLFGAAIIYCAVVCWNIRATIEMQDIAIFSSIISMFFISIGMRRDFGEFTLKWNDRADGRRIRTLPAMSQISPYIMPDRSGAQNMMREHIEVSEVESYIAQKRKEGLKGFGLMHVFVAAYLRAVAKYPGVNRYLSGQKVYSRLDCVVALTIKKSMTLESPDTVIKIKLSPGVTPEEVYNAFCKEIEENKGEEGESTFDLVAKMLTMLPGIVLKFVVWTLKLLDYFGLMPTAIEEVSPFHASMFFTSMGSLGIPAIYHHLYNFGNVPIFCAFGKKYKRNEIADDGTVIPKRYVDYTFNLDERICDGYYFSVVLKQFKRILANPYQLDEPVEVIQDIK